MSANASFQESRRQGALRCLEAMRKLKVDAEDVPDDYRGWLMRRFTDSEKIAKAIGPLPPEAEGAIIALAEYMHYWETTGGANLDPGHWVPVVSLTSDEIESEIKQGEARCAT